MDGEGSLHPVSPRTPLLGEGQAPVSIGPDSGGAEECVQAGMEWLELKDLVQGPPRPNKPKLTKSSSDVLPGLAGASCSTSSVSSSPSSASMAEPSAETCCKTTAAAPSLSSSDPSSPPAPGPPALKKQRFYFESDNLVLKNNTDYHELLKTLAVLEAQKIQAIKDIEQLMCVQSDAERDPLAFVDALRKGDLVPLPSRQQIAELPQIHWHKYTDSLQSVARQHSSVYLHTRKQQVRVKGQQEETSAAKKASKEVACEQVAVCKESLQPRPSSYRQPWTPQEQAKFEELLHMYPPEAVEKRRFEKIANALGTRTTQQVASHVQKYFIKLAKAGLPVPGRMPNLANYTSKSSRKNARRQQNLLRPSTFFSHLAPRVYMDPEATGVAASDSVSSGQETMDLADLSTVGAYVHLDYATGTHLPSHELTWCSLDRDLCGGGSGAGSAARNNGYDADYVSFATAAAPGPPVPVPLLAHAASRPASRVHSTCGGSRSTPYNYLDPNFHPAS